MSHTEAIGSVSPKAALVLCTVLLTSSTAGAVEGPGARRFAVVVASNHGGEDRPVLRHAHSDARAFTDVLVELGGVAPGDVKTLLEPGPDEVLAALADAATLVREVAAAGVRADLVAYYSGHSDEDALLLGGRRLSYDRLRAAVDDVPASVCVVVLDSCSSGGIVRAKGGVRVAPFLLDEATDVRGTAFLLSSSADEASQESDRVGGSYFTHALLTGLRGAADVERDGTVTLTEAYRFAFEETLARTERASGGTQHPTWDMKLSGAGDFVLTDLRDTSARLVLGDDVAGRVFVRNLRGELLFELQKRAPQVLSLAVPAGSYQVLVKGVGTSQASVEVVRGGESVVHAHDLVAVGLERTQARGGPTAPTNSGVPPLLGAAGAATGAVAAVGLGATALYLTAVASDPAGDAVTKQLALDWGPWVLLGTGAGVLLAAGGSAAWLLAPESP